MGNYVDLSPFLEILGRIFLWMWTTGCSVNILGTTFDISFGEMMIGIFLVSSATVFIKIIFVG